MSSDKKLEKFTELDSEKKHIFLFPYLDVLLLFLVFWPFLYFHVVYLFLLFTKEKKIHHALDQVLGLQWLTKPDIVSVFLEHSPSERFHTK